MSDQTKHSSCDPVDPGGHHPLCEQADTLECPCCGDDGAVADKHGEFHDGQALICGCPGWVSVDEDGDVWINNGDDPCGVSHG